MGRKASRGGRTGSHLSLVKPLRTLSDLGRGELREILAEQKKQLEIAQARLDIRDRALAALVRKYGAVVDDVDALLASGSLELPPLREARLPGAVFVDFVDLGGGYGRVTVKRIAKAEETSEPARMPEPVRAPKQIDDMKPRAVDP